MNSSVTTTKKVYENARVAVDGVVLRLIDGTLELLVHRREREPFEGAIELPGGLLLPGEAAEETLVRKVLSLCPQAPIGYQQQYFTFTAPERDPRVRTVSIGYLVLLGGGGSPTVENSTQLAPDCEWFPLFSTQTAPTNMAFDHGEVVERAFTALRQLPIHLLASLLPALFPLNRLYQLACQVYSLELDNRNFRRRVLKSGVVVETDQRETGVSHRPAKLFKVADSVEAIRW